METLRVSRMHARYRVGADDGRGRARLDELLRAVLDDGLEQALARAGVPVHEEICIRSARAALRVSEREGDAAVLGSWSRALADSVRLVIAGGGPHVVRYRTRRQGLVDLLHGVAVGDLRRAWAWRQLGLWRAGDAASPDLAGAQALRALLAEPPAIVGALVGAAHAGALPGLLVALPRDGWVALAREALGAATVGADTVAALARGEPWARAAELPEPGAAQGGDEAALSGGPARATGLSDASDRSGRPESEGATGAHVARAAGRVTRGSALAEALRPLAPPAVPSDVHRALAALAVLEADPGELLRGPAHAAALVRAVSERTGGAAPRASSARADADERISRRRAARASERAEEWGATPEVGLPDGAQAAPEPSPKGGPAGAPPASDAAARPPSRARALPAAPVEADVPVAPPDAPERPLPEASVRAHTEWGGLLFLLHVVRELELPARVLAADALRARPLRWTLHRVAVRLLDLDEHDPAAAAFSGLLPDRPLPWGDDAPATEAEDAVVDELAARVADRAAERLEGVPPADGRLARAAVRACARRRAELVCEPGWFDVLLRLDDVSVEARRAGLDLDPGWLGWLGVVVRFVYA